MNTAHKPEHPDSEQESKSVETQADGTIAEEQEECGSLGNILRMSSQYGSISRSRDDFASQ